MTRQRRINAFATALVIALAALAAYWWWSPVLVLHQMQRAGARGDADAISSHVDYEALRESFKGQFAAAMQSKIGAPSDNPFSALGSALGMAFVNPLIDTMVRPQTLASALQTGRVRPGASPAASQENAQQIVWDMDREGADRVVFHPHKAGEPADPKASAFVFVRRGFANWQLSDIRLQLDR
jgi:hypothetical protein